MRPLELIVNGGESREAHAHFGLSGRGKIPAPGQFYAEKEDPRGKMMIS